MAIAPAERFFAFFAEAFFTPPLPMDIGAGPREAFFAGARFPPTFFAAFPRRFGAVLRVSLIIASSDWSSMAAMVCVCVRARGACRVRAGRARDSDDRDRDLNHLFGGGFF